MESTTPAVARAADVPTRFPITAENNCGTLSATVALTQ
jgi:hypothetical protein